MMKAGRPETASVIEAVLQQVKWNLRVKCRGLGIEVPDRALISR